MVNYFTKYRQISNDEKDLLENEQYFRSLVVACKDRVRKLPDFKHFLKPFFVSPQALSTKSLNELAALNVDSKGTLHF